MIPPSPPPRESPIRLPESDTDTVPPYPTDGQSQLWQDTVQKLDRQITNYNHHTLTRQNPPPPDSASAGAALSSPRNDPTPPAAPAASYDLAESQIQPGAPPAGAQRPEKKESLLKNAGKGVLLLVATPVVLSGVVIYATGMMLEGCGLVLKAIGGGGKKAMVKLSKI